MKAVFDYRKTFPSKQEVLENTPDPAVKQMMLHMEQIRIDTTLYNATDSLFGVSDRVTSKINIGT